MVKIIRTVAITLTIATSSLSLKAQEKVNLSDPEVASVAVTANQIDINSGKLAQEKSKNPQVREFAETMIRDHSAVIQQAVALAKKLTVTPKDNALSKKLMSDAQKTAAALRAKSGSAFDKSYVDNEVAYHKAVIQTVNSVLIPDTQNPELKALLQSIVPALNAHLAHAQMLQKELLSK